MKKGKEIDWIVTLGPLVIVLGLSLLFFLFPDSSNYVLKKIRYILGNKFGTFYLAIGLGVFFLSLYLALSKYGDIVLTKNSKNDVIIMSISEYKRKLKDNELSKKLEKAEQQIKDGKTVKATTVFRELEEKYGF